MHPNMSANDLKRTSPRKGHLVQVKDFAWSLHWDESLQLPGLLMALEAIDSYCWPDDLAW